MKDERGYLVLIGGAEDRRDRMVILKMIMKLSRNGRVVIIPSATMYTDEAIRDYRGIFESIGARSVDGLNIRCPEDGYSDYYIDILEDSDTIFFTGGDQTRLVNSLNKTRVMDKIREKFRDGATIAGTSAGASAVSDPMIYDGDDEGFIKSAVKHTKGLGLLSGITVDTHFLERERIPRLSQLLSSGISSRGIGINEDTAIVISADNKFEVIGSGVVTVMNAEKMRYSSYDEVDRNEPVSVDGVEIGFLASGTVFDLVCWRIDQGGRSVMPGYIEREFEEKGRYEEREYRQEYKASQSFLPRDQHSKEQNIGEITRPAERGRRKTSRGKRHGRQ